MCLHQNTIQILTKLIVLMKEASVDFNQAKNVWSYLASEEFFNLKYNIQTLDDTYTLDLILLDRIESELLGYTVEYFSTDTGVDGRLFATGLYGYPNLEKLIQGKITQDWINSIQSWAELCKQETEILVNKLSLAFSLS